MPGNRLEALGQRSHTRNAGTTCVETGIILYGEAG